MKSTTQGRHFQFLILLASAAILFIFMFGFVVFFLPKVTAADVESLWAESPHADATSESFTHWNDDGKIPANCASCHSSSGFLDYLGADNTAAGRIDADHPIGSVVDCNACHNDAAKELTSVTFPSGIVIDNVESSVQCLVCHQGRASTSSVEKKLAGLKPDIPNPELGFINIHYRAAAATLYGSEVQGGYQYAGKEYAGKFNHVPGFDSCSGCHDPHSLKVDTSGCSGCHQEATMTDFRMLPTDFDGDKNTSEGIAAEIDTIHAALGMAIATYAEAIIKKPIVYSDHAYPYFFNDKNHDLIADPGEAIYPNRYQSWTPRLLRAAYNYQFVEKDPGGYAHNPVYLLQLMYDSYEDLRQALEGEPSGFVRPE